MFGVTETILLKLVFGNLNLSILMKVKVPIGYYTQVLKKMIPLSLSNLIIAPLVDSRDAWTQIPIQENRLKWFAREEIRRGASSLLTHLL
jgi:hypothetical protein